MSKNHSPLTILAMLAFMFSLLPPELHAETANNGHNLLLFYSNDVKGETEACG